MYYFAIDHVFQIVHIILIIIVSGGWRLNSSRNGASVIWLQQSDWEHIVLPSFIYIPSDPAYTLVDQLT